MDGDAAIRFERGLHAGLLYAAQEHLTFLDGAFFCRMGIGVSLAGALKRLLNVFREQGPRGLRNGRQATMDADGVREGLDGQAEVGLDAHVCLEDEMMAHEGGVQKHGEARVGTQSSIFAIIQAECSCLQPFGFGHPELAIDGIDGAPVSGRVRQHFLEKIRVGPRMVHVQLQQLAEPGVHSLLIVIVVMLEIAKQAQMQGAEPFFSKRIQPGRRLRYGSQRPGESCFEMLLGILFAFLVFRLGLGMAGDGWLQRRLAVIDLFGGI